MTVMPSPADPATAGAGMPRPAPMAVPAAEPAGKKGKKSKKGKDVAADGTEQPKKKKTKLIIGVVVVLALVGLKEKGMFIKPHYSAAHPAPAGLVYPLPTTNPFTVTTADGHMVQTNVALQLTTAVNQKKLATDEPAIENAVIQVLGSDTYSTLLSPAGRAQAQQEILSKVQAILGPSEGSPQVTQVLFTGTFVLQ